MTCRDQTRVQPAFSIDRQSGLLFLLVVSQAPVATTNQKLPFSSHWDIHTCTSISSGIRDMNGCFVEANEDLPLFGSTMRASTPASNLPHDPRSFTTSSCLACEQMSAVISVMPYAATNQCKLATSSQRFPYLALTIAQLDARKLRNEFVSKLQGNRRCTTEQSVHGCQVVSTHTVLLRQLHNNRWHARQTRHLKTIT